MHLSLLLQMASKLWQITGYLHYHTQNDFSLILFCICKIFSVPFSCGSAIYKYFIINQNYSMQKLHFQKEISDLERLWKAEKLLFCATVLCQLYMKMIPQKWHFSLLWNWCKEKNDKSQISMQIDLRKKANHNAVKLQFEYLRNKLKFTMLPVKTNESFESKIWVNLLKWIVHEMK